MYIFIVMCTSIQDLSNGVCHAYIGGQILEKCVPKKVRLSVNIYIVPPVYLPIQFIQKHVPVHAVQSTVLYGQNGKHQVFHVLY